MPPDSVTGGTLNRMQLSSRFLEPIRARGVASRPVNRVRGFCGARQISSDANFVFTEHALNERRYQYPYPRGQSRLKQS